MHYQHYIQPITLCFDDALSAMRSLKGIGATPVSYTHLDVYKRQVVVSVIQIALYFVVIINAAGVTRKRTIRDHRISPRSVSYTHLDVYKRQHVI